MSKCSKCNVTILDETDRCPLCGHVIKREGEQRNTYPDAVRVTRRFRFLENLVLFLSLAATAILGGINYMVHPDVMWSLVVALILLYANVVLRLAIIGKSGYLFKTLSLTVFAIVVLLGIDYLTGYRGWSLEFVLPCGIMLLDLGIFILMLVNWRNWQSYMMVQIFAILLSLIPLILLAVSIIDFPVLAFVAFGVSVFLFLGTLILGDVRARTELKRRFHI